MADVRWEHYPHVGGNEVARAWLVLESNLGLAVNTLDAYGRGLEEYIAFSAGKDTAVVTATRDHIAAYIRYYPLPNVTAEPTRTERGWTRLRHRSRQCDSTAKNYGCSSCLRLTPWAAWKAHWFGQRLARTAPY